MAAPTFILDGSNLAWLGPGDGPALAPVDAIADTLRAQWPGCKVITVCDASLRHRLDARDKTEHQRRTKAGELVEAPADEDADAYILAAARQLDGCVVTRDLYRDRPAERAGVPMLRPALIGGAVVLGEPKVYPTADAERSAPADGFAERLAPDPLPGGVPVDARAADDDDDPADAPEPDPPSEAAKPSKTAKASKSTKPDKTARPTPTDDDGDHDDSDDSDPDPPPTPTKPRPKISAAPRATDDDDPPSPPAPKRKATPKRKTAPKSTRKPPERDPAPPSQTALGALILLTLLGGALALAWWLWVDPTPPPPPSDPGVYVIRGCRAWQISDDEHIVIHPRPGECVTSVIALAPGRLAATLDAADARLIVTDGDTRTTDAPLGPLELDAHLIGATTDGLLVRLTPEAGPTLALYAPDGALIRALDGWSGAAHPRAALILAAPDAPPRLGPTLDTLTPIPDPPARRLAPLAALAPDGARYALVQDTDAGPTILIETPKGGLIRRLPLPGRYARDLDGLAWGPRGLYATAAGDLLHAPLDGDWRVIARRAQRVARAL